MSITERRLMVLKKVEETIDDSSVGIATANDVHAKVLEVDPSATKSSTNTMMLQLHRDGLLDRPYRGCYKLSRKAKAELQNIQADSEQEIDPETEPVQVT